MKLKVDDYVKIVGVNGDFRYGYIEKTKDDDLLISLFDEGASKIGFEAASDSFLGETPINYAALLTDIEKRLVPFLAAGYSTKEIGVEFEISPVTVRAHLRTLRIKLQLDNRVQLITFSTGLVKLLEAEKINV